MQVEGRIKSVPVRGHAWGTQFLVETSFGVFLMDLDADRVAELKAGQPFATGAKLGLVVPVPTAPYRAAFHDWPLPAP